MRPFSEVGRLEFIARHGDANASYELGCRYTKGNGVTQDDEKAVKWYRKAASQGHAEAQYILGALFTKDGQSVHKNYETAAKWYGMAAAQGHSDAKYRLCMLSLDGHVASQYDPEDPETVKLYRIGAEEGYANAQYRLGLALCDPDSFDDFDAGLRYTNFDDKCPYVIEDEIEYTVVDGIVQGAAEAADWYAKAAYQGHAAAQYCLASLYYAGEGLTQDYAEAVAWFRKSAEGGYGPALYQLGQLHSKGDGVQQDYVEAAIWYRKAADAGYDYASYDLGVLYLNGQGVQQNYEEAYFWLSTIDWPPIVVLKRQIIEGFLTRQQVSAIRKGYRLWRSKIPE